MHIMHVVYRTHVYCGHKVDKTLYRDLAVTQLVRHIAHTTSPEELHFSSLVTNYVIMRRTHNKELRWLKLINCGAGNIVYTSTAK